MPEYVSTGNGWVLKDEWEANNKGKEPIVVMETKESAPKPKTKKKKK